MTNGISPWVLLAGSIVVAIAGLLGVVGGAVINSRTSLAVERSKAASERRLWLRQRRLLAWVEVLDAANALWWAAEDMRQDRGLPEQFATGESRFYRACAEAYLLSPEKTTDVLVVASKLMGAAEDVKRDVPETGGGTHMDVMDGALNELRLLALTVVGKEE